MNPFVLFKVDGIKGIAVASEELTFPVDDDAEIEVVEVVQENKKIDGFRFILKEGLPIDGNLVSRLTSKAQMFIVNIFGRYVPEVSKFSLKIDQVYDPDEVVGKRIIMQSSLGLVCSVTISVAKPIGTFKEMFEQTSPRLDADYYYSLLFNVMKIDNIVTRYLMQYEILLSLVAPNRKQREVTDYIRTEFNTATTFIKIGFRQTRKAGHAYDEDDITYYRNLLGHNDGSDEVNDSKINQMSSALAQVLFHALNNI